MKANYIGEFLNKYSVVEAAAFELDTLYLKDFVAIILQPTTDKEAQVRMLQYAVQKGNLLVNLV